MKQAIILQVPISNFNITLLQPHLDRGLNPLLTRVWDNFGSGECLNY